VIKSHERARLAGFIGEPRVNVLEINLALDRLR
jgi:K+-transporting ATPase c subunit